MMKTKEYGINKVSYRVFEKDDGSIEIRVCHAKKDVRKNIQDHINDIPYFLKHYSKHGEDDSRARFYLVEIVNDYHHQFEQNKVVFVMAGNREGEKPRQPVKNANIVANLNRPMRNIRLDEQRAKDQQENLDKAILGIAQAYGPTYHFWFENLKSNANPDATWRALMVFSALKDEKLVDQALPLLKSPSSRVRAWTCHYLATIKYYPAINELLRLTRDSSTRVRYSARKAVFAMRPNIGGPIFDRQREIHDHFNVLISEDNPRNRKNLSVLLVRQGYNVHTATSERETMDIALRIKPHIVVTDNQKITGNVMDNLSGLNLAWDLCRQHELLETIIVMLTADFIEPIFLWCGGDAFINKHQNVDAELTNILQEYMNQRELRWD